MNLEGRIQVAEAKGYISVNVESEFYYFFIESSKTVRIGDIVKNCRNKKFKVNKIMSNSRVSAEEVL